MSAIRLAQGRSAEAQELALQALQGFRLMHDHNGIASVLTELGEHAMSSGDIERALGHFAEMRSEATMARNDNHRRTALTRIAACELTRGDSDAADVVLDELSMSLSAERSHWLTPTMQALCAWSHALAGRFEAARGTLELVTGPDDDALRARALRETLQILGEA